MESLLLIACSCLGQGCCWYRVFQCCGCIDEAPHVQIERQAHTPKETPMPSNNPFLATGAPKGAYFESAYKV